MLDTIESRFGRWPLFDAQLRIEHWSNALDQARIVADTLLERQAAPALLSSFWSDQFEAKARFVGRQGCFDVVRMDEPADGALVATFSLQGRVVGALCVNPASRTRSASASDRLGHRVVANLNAMTRTPTEGSSHAHSLGHSDRPHRTRR